MLRYPKCQRKTRLLKTCSRDYSSEPLLDSLRKKINREKKNFVGLTAGEAARAVATPDNSRPTRIIGTEFDVAINIQPSVYGIAPNCSVRSRPNDAIRKLPITAPTGVEITTMLAEKYRNSNGTFHSHIVDSNFI